MILIPPESCAMTYGKNVSYFLRSLFVVSFMFFIERLVKSINGTEKTDRFRNINDI